jgi:hypothetical protein
MGRGREDSNPRLLVLETSSLRLFAALASQTWPLRDTLRDNESRARLAHGSEAERHGDRKGLICSFRKTREAGKPAMRPFRRALEEPATRQSPRPYVRDLGALE